VAIGSLNGVVHIDTINVAFYRDCTKVSIQNKTCEVGYELQGEKHLFTTGSGALPLQVGSTAVPLGKIEANEWEAFFELPEHYFDREICATFSGIGAPQTTVFVRLDDKNPEASLMRIKDTKGCIPFIKNGEQFFTIQNQSFEGIEFSETLKRRVLRTLSNSIDIFEEGSTDSQNNEDLHFSIVLTSELSSRSVLKIVYFIAFILALHPLVLLAEYTVFVGESMHLIIKKYWH